MSLSQTNYETFRQPVILSVHDSAIADNPARLSRRSALLMCNAIRIFIRMTRLVSRFVPVLVLSTSSFAADLFVDNQDPACLGQEPCFSSIQEAIDRSLPGDAIRIQAGVYGERLSLRGKAGIAVGPAEGVPVGGVTLDGRRLGGGCGLAAIEIVDSRSITLRGLVITGFSGPAIQLRGGPQDNRAIRIERNRIFANGGRQCGGGIVIEKGNPDTLVVNNLIYANGRTGIELAGEPGRGRGVPEETRERARARGRKEGLRVGGPHHLIQNTVHGNGAHGIAVSQGQRTVLANNAVTGNGGFGVFRDGSRDTRLSEISLRNNLLCGNASGEVEGPVFVGVHEGNLTPTGAEASGVLAAPECLSPGGVYERVEGTDGRAGSSDDDFQLTGPRGDGLPSPAIDRGVDPRTLGLHTTLDPLLESDYLAPDVRPIQRDVKRPLDFDIGALELPCGCSENCERCEIEVRDDGSSVDRCTRTYDAATECCNRITGEVSSKELGQAYDVCPDTRTARTGFDPEGSSDGCSAVPDRPLLLCPNVRFGCSEDDGEANCPEGIDLPCNRHDFCYQTCGRTQAECDLEFRDEMIAVCNNMTAAEKLVCYDDCLLRAAAYFDGVVIGGGSSYVNGQNRGCQCCQDVFP
jgi:group XII secretory phospholipase A2 precursor (PLA2G12)/parallel beta helix pectate lyase-like protein